MLGGSEPEVNLRIDDEWLGSVMQTSPEVQKRCLSGSQQNVVIFQKKQWFFRKLHVRLSVCHSVKVVDITILQTAACVL